MIITQPDRVLLSAQIARYAPLLRGELLDVGAGRSSRYKELCTQVTRYRTLDHDAAGAPDIVGSAEQIPLPDASVDSVLCTQVLEHVRHPERVVRELFRILRPGGQCLLTVPQMNELHEIPVDFFRYTNFGLRVLFEDAGFTVIAIDQRGKYHSTLAQMRIRSLINRWKPHERQWAMLLLAPWTWWMTRRAIARDAHDCREETAWQTIGWCVFATKA